MSDKRRRNPKPRKSKRHKREPEEFGEEGPDAAGPTLPNLSHYDYPAPAHAIARPVLPPAPTPFPAIGGTEQTLGAKFDSWKLFEKTTGVRRYRLSFERFMEDERKRGIKIYNTQTQPQSSSSS